MDDLEKIKLRLEVIIYKISELKGKVLGKDELNKELSTIQEELKDITKIYRSF